MRSRWRCPESSCSLRERQRKLQLFSEALLNTRHHPIISLVIMSFKVQRTMQDEDLELVSQLVTQPARARLRHRNRDCDVATVGGRKRKYVSGLIFAAKAAVEVAHLAVPGQQHIDLASQARRAAHHSHKALQ